MTEIRKQFATKQDANVDIKEVLKETVILQIIG
jgi:hypothetical protein